MAHYPVEVLALGERANHYIDSTNQRNGVTQHEEFRSSPHEHADPCPFGHLGGNESAGTADDLRFEFPVCIPSTGEDKGFSVGIPPRRPKKAFA